MNTPLTTSIRWAVACALILPTASFAATVVTNGTPFTNLSGAQNSQTMYQIDIPENATNIAISTKGGSGDVDLYVKVGAEPTLTDYDCRPYLNGNDEACNSLTHTNQTYYIMLNGYNSYSGVTLSASYDTDTSSSDDNSGDSSGSDTTTNGGSCQLTAIQQSLLDAHNQARSEARSCGGTHYDAAPALTWNCQLATAAQQHNQDMIQNNIFSHTGSDGSTPDSRIEAAGYSWSYYGENIAAGYPDVDAVMQGWLDSTGHCQNIMNPNFTEMGADEQDATGNTTYSNYWTTDFGRPQ